MAAGLSTVNLANAWLNTLRNTSFAASALYVQLHTADPGASGTSSVSVGSTTRPAVTLAAASDGAVSITGTLPTWTNGGTSETITHITVWSADTSGTFYWSAALGQSKSWVASEGITLTTLGVSLSPLAAT